MRSLALLFFFLFGLALYMSNKNHNETQRISYVCWRIWTSLSTKLLMGHLYTIFTYPNLIQKFKEELEPCRIIWLAAITTTHSYATSQCSHQFKNEIHTVCLQYSCVCVHKATRCGDAPLPFVRSFLPTICVGVWSRSLVYSHWTTIRHPTNKKTKISFFSRLSTQI